MMARVSVVLKRTVVESDSDVSTICAVVIFRIKVSCITSVDGRLCIGLLSFNDQD